MSQTQEKPRKRYQNLACFSSALFQRPLGLFHGIPLIL